MRKPELLAPAGNFEKLEVAVDYGADAVYLAGKAFSLRNFSGNFSDAELPSAIEFARQRGVKTYLACNIFPRNSDILPLTRFLETAGKIAPDALIVADPGILAMAKAIVPHLPIHLSTQANTTNISSVRFWKSQGVTRVNLARELSLSEIETICNANVMEIETFIHGAMCISYSGRCLLSTALSGRDSNQGLCSHPCRWKYAVVEEQRPGEFHPIMEDNRGAYLFNSKDLCMIDHIPELVNAGIASLKIEGRMKGIAYLASVVRTYREAIDTYIASPDTYRVLHRWHDELNDVYHRPYSSGFYFDRCNKVLPNTTNHHHGKIHSFIGRIEKVLPGNRISLSIRNKLSVNDRIEILPTTGPAHPARVKAIFDHRKEPVDDAQPNTTATIQLDQLDREAQPHLILRKI